MRHKRGNWSVLAYLLCIAALPIAAKEITKIAEEAGPAVVLITVYFEGTEVGLGSGFIIDPNGVIVTNYHVIEYSDEARVKLIDGKEYKVKGVYAYDAAQDFAVIAVKAKNLPVIELGDSDSIAVGAPVVAIGNPRGLENTVSEGIVSARREFEGWGKFIQLTAPISPGSSGGALLDTSGAVIGITTASYRESQNLNFAVPINEVKPHLKLAELHELAEVSGSLEGLSSTEVSNYAWSSLDGGKLDDADAYFNKFIELAPDDASGYLGLGHVYFERNNYSKAASLYKKSTELAPDDPQAYRGLANAYHEMNKTTQAISVLNTAYQLDPSDTLTTRMLGCYNEEAGHYQEALVCYQKLIDACPTDAGAYMHKGNCQLKMNEWAEARKAFERSLVIKPDLLAAHIGLGFANMGLGRNGTAVSEFEKALVARALLEEEEILNALGGLGEARLKMGHHRKAQEAYREMLSIDPESAQAHYGLGLAYVAGGDFDAARKEADTLENLDRELARALTKEIKSAE